MPFINRPRAAGIAVAATLTLLAAWSGAVGQVKSPESAFEEQNAGEGALVGAARFREGATLVDQPGAFQLVGDRVVFVFDGETRQMTALENLALERVARAVRESTSAQTWLVTGTITEYQGGNFLLLERAIIRRTTSEPASGS